MRWDAGQARLVFGELTPADVSVYSSFPGPDKVKSAPLLTSLGLSDGPKNHQCLASATLSKNSTTNLSFVM